jgi:hypothetical protein
MRAIPLAGFTAQRGLAEQDDAFHEHSHRERDAVLLEYRFGSDRLMADDAAGARAG